MPGDGFGEEAQFRKVLEVVDDPQRRPVLVHCARGTCRTGSAVALYRFERDGWTIQDVAAEMRRQTIATASSRATSTRWSRPSRRCSCTARSRSTSRNGTTTDARSGSGSEPRPGKEAANVPELSPAGPAANAPADAGRWHPSQPGDCQACRTWAVPLLALMAVGFVLLGAGNLDLGPADARVGLAAGEPLGPLGQVCGQLGPGSLAGPGGRQPDRQPVRRGRPRDAGFGALARRTGRRGDRLDAGPAHDGRLGRAPVSGSGSAGSDAWG